MATCKNPLTSNCQCMHNSLQWFLRIKPIDMSCSKNKNIAKHMTAEIKTDHTRFHKSKFCPVRNRPKLGNLTNDHERVNKNFQDISKLQIHSGLSLTALCTAFCILHCNWEVAILVELQSLHGSLPTIFVGFILQKDACLGLLEIADGSQLDLNQYI